MMTAIPNPIAVSRITVTTVKKMVVLMELQNCEPSVPGGQETVPPPAVHCCSSQCV
jgi:hypothetical protein